MATAKDDTVNMRLISAVAFGLVFLFLVKVTQTPDCLAGEEGNNKWKIQGRNPVDYVFCYPVADVNNEDISIKAYNWSPEKGSSELVQGAPLKGSQFNHAQAAGTFFVKADLYGASFNDAVLDSANFSQANLRDAKLHRAYLRWAKLSQTDLRKADLENAMLFGAKLEKASLNIFTNCYEGCLRSVNLKYAILREADLSEAKLEGANLYNANLQNAQLPKVKLSGACLKKADLTGAYLKEARFNAEKVVSVCEDRLISCDDKALRFRHSKSLPAADLRESSLVNADLDEADLSGADLSGANLQGAQLDGANLSRANLRTADNLTPEQLQRACVYEDTQLPSNIQESFPRSKRCEELWTSSSTPKASTDTEQELPCKDD